MKKIIFSIANSLLFFAAVSLMVACSTPVKLDQDDDSHISSAESDRAQINQSLPSNSGEATVVSDEDKALYDPNSLLFQRSFYFDFDRYNVKPHDHSLLEAHAQFLIKNSQHKLLIQGNTDNRGTREYNLALGQKRAEAIMHALATLGVPEQQMEAVSLGKEKPKALGDDEASYAENRRVDIIYLSMKRAL